MRLKTVLSLLADGETVYVRGGIGDDDDVGRVIDTNEMSATGHELHVAWSSGVTTWVAAEDVRRTRLSPDQWASGDMES